MQKCCIIFMVILMIVPLVPLKASGMDLTNNQEIEEYLRTVETVTGVPWHILAAIYQYEKNIRKVQKGEIPIQVHQNIWVGIGAINDYSHLPFINSFFGGIGKDGDGDGKAEMTQLADTIYSLAVWISEHGDTDEHYIKALQALYPLEKSLVRIQQFSAIYKHNDTISVAGNSFPIPLNYSYSYRSTWGAGRSFGGRRSHEGTDIFARSWTPVKSTSHGIVEIKGWNKYGGWRVGIRDLNNVYHYYAHLAGYSKDLKEGDIIKPGQVIGYVGSSGYGKQGTTGKFPPHLHYGMYRDTGGKYEWAFDPTPSLHRWEKNDKKGRR
ncbi:hypothetical protein BHU72_07785 [Desulfuribacillus stibiiarsenatis]|uniref:M23ase beta-sheet core domain-containing protein n=2 Tax=Desulfuribacillus stibiiarsenatis TaxID=1390249 RepID=A0A1E5L3V8_9FIRM|nr:hypothetical protein BHU72_07785 [Desulfuribacillus stibiiarsenatis]